MPWTWVRLSVQVTSGNIISYVGGNTISSVDPDPGRTAVYTGVSGIGGLFAYSGMAFAPTYGASGGLVINGGGHADYGGNEVYVFNLATNLWSRINNPSTALPALNSAFGNEAWNWTAPYAVDKPHGEFADGSPITAHTYSALTAIPGGASGKLIAVARHALSWSGVDHGSGYAHQCDLTTGVWSLFSTNASTIRFDGVASDCACYDAVRGRIWETGKQNELWYTTIATGVKTGPVASFSTGFNTTCARVPVNDLMLCVTSSFGAAPLGIYAIDLANPGSGRHDLTISGTVPTVNSAAPGFDWSTDHNCGYIYIGNWTDGGGGDYRDRVWKLTAPASNPLTNAWTLTQVMLPTSFPLGQGNGVFGRWKYCTTIKKFAHVPSVSGQVVLWTPPA